MSNDICCVINAHREGTILFATIQSVKRAVGYANSCGLNCSISVVLDRSDKETKEIVQRESSESLDLHEVDFGDLAHSRNYATENSTGNYTAFVDGDDMWSKTWLLDAYLLAEKTPTPVVLHPEYNIFFGGDFCHVFNHVDMEATDFEIESFYRMNYWTALSFAKTSIYKKYPYKKNRILDGFGYEDWTWNFETIMDGVVHKVVPGTVHFIRKGRQQESLLEMTNKLNALPRVLNIYREKQSVVTNDSETLCTGLESGPQAPLSESKDEYSMAEQITSIAADDGSHTSDVPLVSGGAALSIVNSETVPENIVDSMQDIPEADQPVSDNEDCPKNLSHPNNDNKDVA